MLSVHGYKDHRCNVRSQGESLETRLEKYSVSVEQCRNWNEKSNMHICIIVNDVKAAPAGTYSISIW